MDLHLCVQGQRKGDYILGKITIIFWIQKILTFLKLVVEVWQSCPLVHFLVKSTVELYFQTLYYLKFQLSYSNLFSQFNCKPVILAFLLSNLIVTSPRRFDNGGSTFPSTEYTIDSAENPGKNPGNSVQVTLNLSYILFGEGGFRKEGMLEKK